MISHSQIPNYKKRVNYTYLSENRKKLRVSTKEVGVWTLESPCSVSSYKGLPIANQPIARDPKSCTKVNKNKSIATALSNAASKIFLLALEGITWHLIQQLTTARFTVRDVASKNFSLVILPASLKKQL